PVDGRLLHGEANVGYAELPGVRQGRIVGDEVGARGVDRFAVDRNWVRKIPGDHARLAVTIRRTAVLDRHALDAAGKVERPGHGIGIGGIDALDNFHFLRREVLVPTELLEHAEGELRISVLDFRAGGIRALGEQVVVLLLFDFLPVFHHLALDNAFDTEAGTEGAAAFLHVQVGVVEDRRPRMFEIRRSPAWPRQTIIVPPHLRT